MKKHIPTIVVLALATCLVGASILLALTIAHRRELSHELVDRLSVWSPERDAEATDTMVSLVQQGAYLDHKDGNKQTPLALALYVKAPPRLVLAMLHHGADPTVKTPDGLPAAVAAADYDDLDLYKAFLDHGAKPDAGLPSGITAAHRFAAHGNLDALHYLASLGVLDPDDFDPDNSPLATAVADQPRLATARWLIDRGFVADAADRRTHATILGLALRHCNPDMVALLLEHGARLTYPDAPSLREMAIRWMDVPCDPDDAVATWRRLAELGVHVVPRDPKARPVLLEATHGDTLLHESKAEALLELGARLNVADRAGRTPLHIAAERDRTPLVRLFLKHGGDEDARDRTGATPLLLACRSAGTDTIRCLLDNGADVNAADHRGLTPLHEAARRDGTEYTDEATASSYHGIVFWDGGELDSSPTPDNEPLSFLEKPEDPLALVRLLLEHGARVDPVDRRGRTPLHLAVQYQNREIAGLLLEKGAAVDVIDKAGNRPLLHAIRSLDRDMVTLLLDHGASRAALPDDGRPPLHEAVRQGETGLVELVLGTSPLPKDRNPAGATALLFAITSDKPQVADLLLRRGAEVNVADKDGRTPLHEAIRKQEHRLAEQLITAGADVKAADKKGLTPLHEAIRRQDTAMARLLVKEGADVNVADHDGWTPLHEAALHLLEDTTKLLIDKGARVDARDKWNRTPLWVGQQACIRNSSFAMTWSPGPTPGTTPPPKPDHPVLDLLLDHKATAPPPSKGAPKLPDRNEDDWFGF